MVKKYQKKYYKKKYEAMKDAPLTLAKLEKKLIKLEKVAKQGVDTVYLQQRYGYYNMSLPYFSENLMSFPSMRAVFGTGVSDYANANTMTHKKLDIDILIDQGNEPANVDLTVYLVTLTHHANIYNPVSGTFYTLISGLHYADQDSGTANPGMTWLNPQMFNVHKTKRIQIGNNNIAGSVASGTAGNKLSNRVRFQWSLKPNHKLIGQDASVVSYTCAQDPAHQYFLLIFNNNLSGDLEYPIITYNCIHTFELAM